MAIVDTPGLSAAEKTEYMNLAFTSRGNVKILNKDIEELELQSTGAQARYYDASVKYYNCVQ